MTPTRNNEHESAGNAPPGGGDDDAVDIDLAEDDEPKNEPASGSRGLYVVFAFGSGRRLELHVPHAKGVMIGGHSDAAALSFRLVNRSVETSGPMILVGAEDVLREGG